METRKKEPAWNWEDASRLQKVLGSIVMMAVLLTAATLLLAWYDDYYLGKIIVRPGISPMHLVALWAWIFTFAAVALLSVALADCGQLGGFALIIISVTISPLLKWLSSSIPLVAHLVASSSMMVLVGLPLIFGVVAVHQASPLSDTARSNRPPPEPLTVGPRRWPSILFEFVLGVSLLMCGTVVWRIALSTPGVKSSGEALWLWAVGAFLVGASMWSTIAAWKDRRGVTA